MYDRDIKILTSVDATTKWGFSMKSGLLKRDVDMLNGPITKGMLALAVPVILTTILSSLFNTIDMAVLRNFTENSDIAVGSIGAVGSLNALTVSLINGIAVGAGVITARSLGSGDKEKVKRSVGTAMAFTLAGGIFLMVLGILLSEQLLIWTNCDPVLLPGATLYFQLHFATMPLTALTTYTASLLRAKGDTQSQMFITVIVGVLKVLASIVAIAMMDLGLVGLSLATWVAMLVSGVLYTHQLWKKGNPVYIESKDIRFYATELKGMLYIGIPSGLQAALYSVANVVIQTTVNSFGKEATAGLGIANTYDGIIYNVSVGVATAVLPYMGQNLGAGNNARAKTAMLRGTLLVVLIGGSLGALSAIFSGPLSAIMSSDPKVIAFSQQKMIIISSAYFICGINEVMNAALRALKKPIVTTVAALLFTCGLRFLWVYVIYPYMPNNLTFLYLVWPVGWILSILMVLPFIIYNFKKLEKEQSPLLN